LGACSSNIELQEQNMPEEITSAPKTEPTTKTLPTGSGDENQSVSLNLSHVVGFCALALLGCFFLPWLQILFARPSGFNFAQEGGKYLLLWSIPVFCVLTFFAGITKTSQRAAAQFTGMLPFCFLGVGLYSEGADLMKVLTIGAYASLVLGLLLILLPTRLK
jgi:hypothetical protein